MILVDTVDAYIERMNVESVIINDVDESQCYHSERNCCEYLLTTVSPMRLSDALASQIILIASLKIHNAGWSQFDDAGR